jgi:hypothetical protein
MLIASGPCWQHEIAVSTVARCQLYNALEARVEWHPVLADWAQVRDTPTGWMLPCRVDIPFVNTVITFELHGTRRAALQAVELSIPADTVVECDPTYARLLTLDLLPGFGAAHAGEAGYLLLPCFCGAIHRFTHGVSREERVTLYAEQAQWAMRSNFNCIGMHTEDASWCAVVCDGEFDAQAVIRSHAGEDAVYSIHPGLVYRWAHTDALLPGTRTVRYYLCDPTEGGWSAFARRYRRFLREERGVRTWAEKAEDNPRVLDFAHSFPMKIFQGCKTRAFDGQGTYQPATSFAEAREILQRMQADGIRRITAQMVGWNLGGHDGCYPTRFPINPVEGGEADFRELIAWGKDHQVCVTAHDNYQDSYEVSDDYSCEDGMVLRDGSLWRNVPWSGGFNMRMCPLRSIRHAQRDLPQMKALGIKGNYYLDALAAFNTCHASAHPANRATYLAAFREILTYTRELFGTLSLEVPYGPYFDLMDGVYLDDHAAGLAKFTDFVPHFIDGIVPFLPIALHNSVCYQCGGGRKTWRADALRALAWGGKPTIEVSARPAMDGHTMPTYADLADFAREGYRLCCEEFGDRITQDLDEVATPEPGVYHSRYGDGVSLLVNTGTTPAVVDGQVVAPQSVVRR